MSEIQSPAKRSGIIMSVLSTAAAAGIGTVIMMLIEIDRTQEVVLERLDQLEAEVQIIPLMVNDDDRWTKSEEDIYQQGIDHRLKALESFHPPYPRPRR